MWYDPKRKFPNFIFSVKKKYTNCVTKEKKQSIKVSGMTKDLHGDVLKIKVFLSCFNFFLCI